MLGNPAIMTNITNETKLHVSPFVVDFYATARIFDMQTHEGKITSNTLVKKFYEIVPDPDRIFMRLTRDLNNYMIILTECAFFGDGETSIHFARNNDKQKSSVSVTVSKIQQISQSDTSNRIVVRPGIDDEQAFPPFVSKKQYVYAIRCHRQTNKADSNFF